jgi:hypothetical protein
MSKNGAARRSPGLTVTVTRLLERPYGLSGRQRATTLLPATHHGLVKVLREEGCNVLEKIDESEYGKFAWVIDPEGNKLELWQPPAGQ